MNVIIKTIFMIIGGLIGLAFIFILLWYGMPKIRMAFEEKKIISVTIKLINKCSLTDDSFVVTVPGTNIIVPFKNGIARLRLKSDRKVQLKANPKYPAIRYDGIYVDVEKNMELEADCTTSPRLKGIFKSLKKQFNEK